jgi:hypothetical protein
VIAPRLMWPIQANCTRIRVKAEVAATWIRRLPQCPKTNTLDILPYTQRMRIVVSAVRSIIETRQALAQMKIAQSSAFSAARQS